MGFKCGIVGLPNVGKSSIFNALTSQHIPAENYPFCTIDHNTGIVTVPDERLDKIATIFNPERVVATTVEFVDIAGLVKNAHSGEGLGNKFLHHISEVDAIAHVVRCFDDNNVAHVEGSAGPRHDIEIINTELMLSDLAKVEKQIEKNKTSARTGNKEAKILIESLEKAKEALDDGIPLRNAKLSDRDTDNLRDLSLLSLKPVLYIANGNETDIVTPSEKIKEIENIASTENSETVTICGSIESELVDLSADEQREFLNDLGISDTGLVRLIHAGYKLLNLVTFFTKEGVEVKAWTVKRGTTAPKAAGKIHTDFEKGFIKADVFSYSDLIELGSEEKLKSSGKIRSEGHEYIIKDGDIVQFKFNV